METKAFSEQQIIFSNVFKAQQRRIQGFPEGAPTYFYRPQTKFGARLYVYRCVSVHGGVAVVWCLVPGGCQVPGGCLVPRGVPGPGGYDPGGGVPAPGGGGLVLGGCLLLGGAWWRPPDGYCCGQYASYWNAFLFWLIVPENCMKMEKKNWTGRGLVSLPTTWIRQTANVQ